jgi:hypothetical protein
MGSVAMIYIPSFINIDSGRHLEVNGGGDTNTESMVTA